jgi:hydrogenase maturation protein HypF
MTSANRSNEPIAYQDDDAIGRLTGIADAFLVGERPIARRVDDSVVRVGILGTTVLRRARGYAPGAVARLPVDRPILALGPDLKNTVALVVDGQAFISQHIGDLEHYEAFQSFTETIRDLTAMYDIPLDRVLLVHDCHPQYASSVHAQRMTAPERRTVQHHRAHIASVLAEREAWDERVIGVSFDGTGYGDDGGIWGGEVFVGSVAEGLERVAHLRTAVLPGGDAAARYPVQAAAGFLAGMDGLPDFVDRPFDFPGRYRQSVEMTLRGVRTFPTTSAGRLFDTAAALVGFTRGITFEGQAAMWLEHLAGRCTEAVEGYPFPMTDDEMDYRPLLHAVIDDRLRDRDPAVIARRFHLGIAQGVCGAVLHIAGMQRAGTVVLSGGVFQNQMLLRDLKSLLGASGLKVWTNTSVPPNDGGVSLGQAALAAFGQFNEAYA